MERSPADGARLALAGSTSYCGITPLGATVMLRVSPPTRNSSMREPESSMLMRSMRCSLRPDSAGALAAAVSAVLPVALWACTDAAIRAVAKGKIRVRSKACVMRRL